MGIIVGASLGSRLRLKDTACGRCVFVAGWVVVFGRMLSDSRDLWPCMTASDVIVPVRCISVAVCVAGGSGDLRCMVLRVRCCFQKFAEAHVVRACIRYREVKNCLI